MMSTARLKRSKDKVIAGVCGGIADHLGWDPAKVRLIYVLLSIFSAGFPGVLLYLILMIVMPND